MGQMGVLVANSRGALQSRSYACGARARVLRGLYVHSARTPSSQPSGGINCVMFITASAALSTCGSTGSPHAVIMKGRQRRDRSDLSECAAGTAGRGMLAARASHGSHPWYSDQTVPARVRGESRHTLVKVAPPTLTTTVYVKSVRNGRFARTADLPAPARNGRT